MFCVSLCGLSFVAVVIIGEADEAAPNLGGEKVKPVYVNGQRITMQAMAENDAAADELANL